MKKLLFFLLLAAALPSFGQSWAAPGATWYYDFQYFAMTGYERVQKIGDTTINNLQYDKLQIFRSYYDQSSQMYGSYYVSQLEFTRADSGVVYFYRDSVDYVLYDFNAQTGDTWLLHGEPQFNGGPCDTGSVVVDSVSSMIVNGDTLRIKHTSPVNWNGITFFMPVAEKIGGMANLLPTAICVTDVPQGYNLRCYSDSTGWTYQNPNWNYACDDMMGVDEANPQETFSLIYNNDANLLTLTGEQIIMGAVIEVFDARGQLIQRVTAASNHTVNLNLPGVAAGVYMVNVTTNQFHSSQKFFVDAK
jgi:hypothetical protein